jgi:hypothetical protein
MAKADDTISERIWLHEALKLAADALGSRALAEKRLRQWLATRELPWDCMDWEALDAESDYHNGDSQFWRAHLKIDWQDSSAWQSAILPGDIEESPLPWGACARGIRVPRARLLKLLPAASHENKEANPAKLGADAWLAWARTEYPKQRNERPTAYIRRLHGLMQNADNVTKVWKYETFRNRYYEAVKADQQAVQKERKSRRPV